MIEMIPLKIIIRLPNWLGDCVMALPVIEDLYKKWPNASIDVLVQGSCAELLKNNPYINKIISFQKKDRASVIPIIKKQSYDLGILLTNSFSSAWILWRGSVKKIVGFTGKDRRLFLDYKVSFPKNRAQQHLVLTYKSLLKPLGIVLSDTDPKLYINSDEKEAALGILKAHHVPTQAHLIGINPAAAYGTAKCWLPDRFQAVTKKLLANPNHWVIFFGDSSGKELIHQICEPFSERVIDLSGKTNLRQLVSLINQCDAFLTNDSGPMHIAAALKRPLVALFGSTNEIATGPYKWGKVIHKHVACSPCYKRVCPIDFKCMKQINVDEVFSCLTEPNLYDRNHYM